MREWHDLHRAIRLSRSCLPPSLSGFLWWISCVSTMIPRSKHNSPPILFFTVLSSAVPAFTSPPIFLRLLGRAGDQPGIIFVCVINSITFVWRLGILISKRSGKTKRLNPRHYLGLSHFYFWTWAIIRQPVQRFFKKYLFRISAVFQRDWIVTSPCSYCFIRSRHPWSCSRYYRLPHTFQTLPLHRYPRLPPGNHRGSCNHP